MNLSKPIIRDYVDFVIRFLQSNQFPNFSHKNNLVSTPARLRRLIFAGSDSWKERHYIRLTTKFESDSLSMTREQLLIRFAWNRSHSIQGHPMQIPAILVNELLIS